MNKQLLFAVLTLFMFSCNGTKNKETETFDKEIDCIHLHDFLSDAFEYARDNDIFEKEYELCILDSLDTYDFGKIYQAKVRLKSDYLFSEDYPHLLLHFNIYNNHYIEIYEKKDTVFHKLLSLEEGAITYGSDSIWDVNGDGYNDFVINGYGSSGCCLKAFSKVFLFNPQNSEFSDYIEFLNPTFFPEEGVIRGVNYGYAGETELYKYKWGKDNDIILIEYIYYETDTSNSKTGKVIVSKELPNTNSDLKILKRLDAVPEEYKQIYGYDWFIGKDY